MFWTYSVHVDLLKTKVGGGECTYMYSISGYNLVSYNFIIRCFGHACRTIENQGGEGGVYIHV